jgi:hypothetical protein
VYSTLPYYTAVLSKYAENCPYCYLFQFWYFDPHLPKSRWSPFPQLRWLPRIRWRWRDWDRLAGCLDATIKIGESPLQDFWRNFLNSHCRLLLKENVTLPWYRPLFLVFDSGFSPYSFLALAVDTKLPMTMITLKGTAAWGGLSQKNISRYCPFTGIGKIHRCEYRSPLSDQVSD